MPNKEYENQRGDHLIAAVKKPENDPPGGLQLLSKPINYHMIKKKEVMDIS